MSTELRIIIDIVTMLVMAGFCLLVVAWLKRSGGRLEETGYRNLFIFGIVWVSFGIIGLMVSFITDINIFMAEPFLVIGLAPLIFGLAYRNKLKKLKNNQGDR